MKPPNVNPMKFHVVRCLLIVILGSPIFFSSHGAAIVDKIRPTVTITAPIRGLHVTNETVAARGTARDNISLTDVVYRVENSAGVGAFVVAAGTTNWNGSVSLQPGLNTIRARSSDGSTNVSLDVTTTVSYDVYKAISLTIDSGGRVLGATNNQKLLVAKAYTLTAIPLSGYVFLGWTNNSGLNPSTKPTLTFTNPIEGMSIQARFGPSTFSGMFLPESDADANRTNCGYFTFTRTAAGTLSGRILMEAKTIPFSGKRISTEGTAEFDVTRPGRDALHVSFTINATNVTLLNGTVRDAGFSSKLIASSPSATKNPWIGNYTAVVTSDEDANDFPAPYGYGPMYITVSGANAAVRGTLADGTPFSTSAPIASELYFAPRDVFQSFVPIYIPLQGGKGMFGGFIALDRGPKNEFIVTNPDGRTFWQKNPTPTDTFYKDGFRRRVHVFGARYYVPGATQTVINATNAIVTIKDGNAADAETGFEKKGVIARTKVTLLDNSSDTNAPSVASLQPHLFVNPTTGAVTGDFKNPGTGKVSRINGVAVQYPGLLGIGGFFTGTNRSGSILIFPE